MLIAFALQDGQPVQLGADAGAAALRDAAWIDLFEPTEEEHALVESLYREDLPDVDDVDEIEASARSFEDANGLHVFSLFFHHVEGRARNTSVAFTLGSGRLLTLHERDIPAVRLLRMRVRRDPRLLADPAALLLTLFETKVESVADSLEYIYAGLEQTSRKVLEDADTDLEAAIDELTEHEDENGKVRLCLMDTQRDLTFLLRRGHLGSAHADWIRELLRDIDSLLPHNSYLFEKVNFLMQAAQGFINIEQNQIIKIFSIAAVVFLPPTLVASIYGMNFRFMPELDWIWGYPLALGLMVLSGVSPYFYFKHKGWL